ncbi:hypothetical protein PM082_016749 [Marasmius tenuissimus]|nr:hypothetical protein PM082_016749 [Marasmius tenuissimus]
MEETAGKHGRIGMVECWDGYQRSLVFRDVVYLVDYFRCSPLNHPNGFLKDLPVHDKRKYERLSPIEKPDFSEHKKRITRSSSLAM